MSALSSHRRGEVNVASLMSLPVHQAGSASAQLRIQRIKQVAAVKDRSGDYRDWRYLCDVVRVKDDSEVRNL